MNEDKIISIICKRPDLLEWVRKLGVSDSLSKQLDTLEKVYKENKQFPALETLKQYWDIDTNISDADVSFLLTDVESYQKKKFVESLYADKENLSIEEVNSRWKKLVPDTNKREVTEFQVDNVNDLFAIWKNIEDESNIGKIPSGYSAINEKIEGGFKNGSSICWLGPSGSGKTLWLCNEAANIWHGQEKRVLYISTEMNEKAIFSRIMRSAFNSSTQNMVKSLTSIQTSKQYPWPQIKVIKVHPNDTNCNEIQERIDQLDWKPEVIVIDYFDEIRATEKSANEYDKHGIVASDIKKLAEVNNCPVITATQANRSALDEGGGSKEIVSAVNIGDSYKKVRTLDLLLCIIQPKFLKSVNKYELYIDKNRYGPSNTSVGQFDIDWDTMKITSSNTLTTNPSKTSKHDKALDNFNQQTFEDTKEAEAAKEEDPKMKKYILAWNRERITDYIKQSTFTSQKDKEALKIHLLLIKNKIEGAENE